MKPLYLLPCVMFAVLFTLTASQGQDDKKTIFEGEWLTKSITLDGKKVPEKKFKGGKLTIKGNTYTIHIGKQKIGEGTFKYDSSKNPGTIDIQAKRFDDKQIPTLAIYKLEGNKLTVCASPSGKDRPEEFVSKPGTGQELIVYERKK